MTKVPQNNSWNAALDNCLMLYHEKCQDNDLHWDTPHRHWVLQNAMWSKGTLKRSFGVGFYWPRKEICSTCAMSHKATRGQCMSAGTTTLPWLQVSPRWLAFLKKVFSDLRGFLEWVYLLAFLNEFHMEANGNPLPVPNIGWATERKMFLVTKTDR